MPDHKTYMSLVAEVDLLKRKFNLLIERSGLSVDDADDIEFNAILDHCTATNNYKPLQEYQSRKNAQQGATV